MKTSTLTVGRRGEDAACEYLLGHGYAVLERNWRSGHLEIDIITLGSDGLHIVEVKSRVAPLMADPLCNINAAKLRHLHRAAIAYLHSSDSSRLSRDLDIWFDVVTVVFDHNRTIIEHYPKAYTPIYA